MHYQLILVGDSDIDRWPEKLLPCLSAGGSSAAATSASKTIISGHSGSTLNEILPYVQECLGTTTSEAAAKATSSKATAKHKSSSSSSSSSTNEDSMIVTLVVCAGENDIGNGTPLSQSEDAFRKLLDVVFDVDNGDISHRNTTRNTRRLLFLGPKIEPWLQDDHESRDQYIRMSKSFQRICNEYNTQKQQQNIILNYIDCLLMFCTEDSVQQKGALFGGKAVADSQYFDSDGLHLSNAGYKTWKNKVEECIKEMR